MKVNNEVLIMGLNPTEKIYPDYDLKEIPEIDRYVATSTLIKQNAGSFYKIPLTAQLHLSTPIPKKVLTDYIEKELFKIANTVEVPTPSFYVLNSDIPEFLKRFDFVKRGFWYEKDYNDFIEGTYITKISINHINSSHTTIIAIDYQDIKKETVFRGYIKTIDNLQAILKCLDINITRPENFDGEYNEACNIAQQLLVEKYYKDRNEK